jgi:hypothetical protein
LRGDGACGHSDVYRRPVAIVEQVSGWEKAQAAEQERGIDRDLESEKEPGSAWDELKQARSNEWSQENEEAPEREDEPEQGQGRWNERKCGEPEQVKENEQAPEREDEWKQGEPL